MPPFPFDNNTQHISITSSDQACLIRLAHAAIFLLCDKTHTSYIQPF